MAAVQQQHDHDHQRKLVHKQFNSPMGLYSDQNVKETLDREIKAFGGSGIELDNQYIGKPSNLQNSAVLKMLEEEESERYTAKSNQITTERQSRSRNRCTVDRDTVLKINRRQPKRDYSWPPPNLICSRSRSSSDEQFNEEIRHKHNIDHIKEMFDKGIIFQHKNISTINKINLTKNSETLINRNTNKNNNNNNINIRSRSLNDNFHDNNNNNNTNNNNELQSNTNYNLTETNLMKNDNTESLVKKKILYLPENELYIGMVEPTRKYFEKLSKNSEYPLQYQKSPTTTNTNELLSDGSLTFTKKWKSTENFIDFQPLSYHNDNNSETRTKHDSSQQIFNSSSIMLKSDNNNNFINKNIKIYTPGIITDTNTINKVTATNNTNLRTLSLDRQQYKKKYNSNSFNELPPLKPRGEYRKNLHSTTNNNKTKLNLNNTQNNKIMENKIPNKTIKVFNENCINENEKFSNHQKSSKEICCNKNESIIQVKENIENSKNVNTKIRQATSDNNKMNDIKLKISTNNYENCNDIIIKINNENFKSIPKQIQTKNIIKSSNNRISYSTEPTITIKDVGKTLLNFHEPSDNISNSSKNYTSTSNNKNNKKNINGMQKNIIICNISDADESTKRIQSAITPTTIQNENINNKNDNKIEQIKTKIRKTQEPPLQPSKSGYEIFETKLSDGQNEFYPSVNDDFCPNDITNFSYDNKIILGQGSQYKNYNLSDKFSKITSSTTSVTTTPDDNDDDDQDRYKRGNNNTKNIRYSKNDSMSSISLTPTAQKSFSLTKQNDNQILTNSDNHNNCNNNNNNNKLVKQNSPLNLTQKDNFIGKTNDEENFPTSLSININENIKMKKKKLLYPPEMIITSDGINRIVNIINLNQNKDLQNSNNKLYNQLSSSSSLATRTTSSLSSLLSSPMYSKDFHLNDDKKPYREINIIPNITKKNNRICFFDSITQDDNKKNLDDENFIKSFLQQPKQENITLVVKTKNEIYENDKNDDNTDDDKNYSCLETNKIDTKPTTDKAINLTTKMVTTTDDTNNNVDNKTNATTLKQTTNTIIPSIKKIYYKPSPTTFTIDKNDEKRHGIYYTDGIDIWQENGKILSNNLKPIDLLNKENNDYKQVHLIDDKLNDLLLKKIQTDDEYNKYEKYNENQFKIELINKINDNNNNNVIDKNKIISENLILNVIPIKNNINQIDIDNNELQDDENHLPIPTITNNSTSSLCGKYSKIQKSISEDLRRIDSYMESAEKSLYNIESSNDIYDETPLKKVMKHFMFNNNYNQQAIKNFNKDQIYDPLLINQTENMPVVKNVLDDLYNMSLLLDSNNKINQYDNNETGNNKANNIELNIDTQLAEDQSKDDTNSNHSTITSVTETLSINSEPSSTRTINFDKIIQSKNILSGYLITKQNQEELLEKASSVIHDNPSLIDYNNNINSNYLIDYNENCQHNVDKIDLNIEGNSTSSPPSIKINGLQQGQQENFNDNINSLLKFNDKEKLSNSNNNENNVTNKILKIDCNKMNQENINNKDNNVHHHQNHYKIMSPNKIADNVNFKIDKSQNLKYNVENDNKQIHHNHQQHEKNYNLHNEYPKLITTQNFQNNVINKDVTSIQCNERTIKRSSPNTKVEIYIENNNDNNDNDDDTNNNDKVNDNKSNKIGCAYKTPNNDKHKNIEIIIPTKSNQIELSSVAQLANNIKLVETNELTPSPTLSTYDNNILDKCDNIKSNTIMMTMMPSEINFNKQHNIQYYNHETKSRNSVADDDIIVNSRCDDNNSYRHQTSGDNITNKIGINKNNYRIMNNVLVDVDDDGRCGIMKNSINGEYCDNDDGYNINTINTNNTCYDLLNNNTEEYNQELTNKVLDDMEIYYYENNKNNKDYNNIDDDIYQKNHSNNSNNNSVVIESNFIKSSSMNRECNQSQLQFIDNTIDNIDDDIIKPKYQLRCTSQPPPIKHLVEISNDYIINFDSRNYYNLNRQHSYDSNINNCDNNQYLMSSPTLQLYPLEDGRYEWTNEGYKRVAWPPADQARTYRAYTPTPQPPNQQPNQDNNSLQSQPTQSQYPQQLQSGGQSQQQQQHQPQQQQPSQNPSSYQPINQGYQKPNYPGANQPSSQQGHQPQQSRPQPGYQPEQSRPQPGYQPQQSRPQQGYQPEQSRPQPGYQPEQSRPQPGYQPEQSRPQPGYQPEQSRPQPGYQPQQSRPQQGYQPEQSRPQPGYQPEQSRPQPGYQPEQSRPQPGYQPEQSRPQPGYQPQKSHPDQGYVHPLNQQSQPHSPQMQQPNSNPYQQSGHVPYPHQDNNNMYPPYSYQTSSAPPSHMNGPSSTASFTGGVAQRPSAGLPQYNPQSKPFQSQYNVPSPSAQSYQQQPAQTGDDQQRGWTHVATPAPAARPGYTQSVYQPNTIGGGAGHATPQYGSQFGSNQNISGQQQPTNQAYHQSVPVSHNQPLSGQQFYQQPSQQQQNQMHPAQNQYHQQPSSFESQNNQYNQQQPQQQYNSQADQTNPGVITLRRETPTHQPPAPVIVSQPATKNFRGGSVMRGDLKWPPQDCRERMAADAEWEEQLSLGPACRPTKQQKDYSGFFAKHALSHNYPGYKIPPGTQHIEATY